MPTMLKDKISYGIACCRHNNDRAEILLIRKRYTYAFSTFVRGKYNTGSACALAALFNGMTLDEKLIIMSLDFSHMWYRIWLDSPVSGQYFAARNKFENAFMSDGGMRLRALIAKSTTSDLIWEIPKGHKKSKAEMDIHCAIREFAEETCIRKSKYKLIPGITIKTSYIDDNIRYINIYYVAYVTYNISPGINFRSKDQLSEISDIRWVDMEHARLLDTNNRIVPSIRRIFNYLKKHIVRL
jgi:8-oxo-dGTP pyrophosphatase MutT (NUDIX family)